MDIFGLPPCIGPAIDMGGPPGMLDAIDIEGPAFMGAPPGTGPPGPGPGGMFGFIYFDFLETQLDKHKQNMVFVKVSAFTSKAST